MQYSKILQKIGLSERESLIYIDLLENETSTISDIAKRTNLHRPVVYSTLPVLEES
jgi:sugar-specific transcriptional regulator TrmB